MKSLKFISFIISILLLASCSETLDFNQLEDFNLSPKFSTSLIYFKVNPNDFPSNNLAASISSISDELELEEFETKLPIRLDLIAEVKNESNRILHVNITFLDIAKEIIFEAKPLIVSANKSLDFSLMIDIIENPVILKTRFIKYTIVLEDNGNASGKENAVNDIVLKSWVDIYLESNF